MNKILLIRPPSVLKMVWPNIPLGIGILAGVLEKNDITVAVRDYLVEDYRKDGLVEYINSNNIDAVGISIMTMDYYNARMVIADIKAHTSASVIVGGPHATVSFDELLKNGADYAVVGEGEETVLDLVRYLKGDLAIEKIPGIAYLANGQVTQTGKRKLLVDLDSLPQPAFHLLSMERYAESARNTGGFNILSSRGCPADCHFCLKAIFGYKLRKRSPGHIVEEIEVLHRKYGISAFCFVDDYFLSRNEWIEELCDLLTDSGIKARYWAQGRVDNNIRPDVFSKMVRTGFDSISFGVESGDQQILNRIGKKITLQQVRDSIAKAKNAGFQMIEAGFILGFPWDTCESMERTVRFAVDIDTTNVHVTFFTPYPGTKLRKEIEGDPRISFNSDYTKLDLLNPSVTTDMFNEEDLCGFYNRLFFLKLKKRFIRELANIPRFITALIKERQTGKQLAYKYFPSIFSYASTLRKRT